MSNNCGDNHGWYAAAKGKVLCHGWVFESMARYENNKKRSNGPMYPSYGHFHCGLLVKVLVIGLGMSLVWFSW